MTSLQLFPVDTDTIERLAHTSGKDIEIDTARNVAYLRIGDTTFVAELPTEVCS